MFDFLDKTGANRAISAVYYAVRLISHRRQLDNVYDGLRAEKLESEPSALDEELAFSIVREIESAEESALQDIEDSSAGEYVVELSQIAQQRAADEFGYDADQGREILEQLEPAISQQVGQNSM